MASTVLGCVRLRSRAHRSRVGPLGLGSGSRPGGFHEEHCNCRVMDVGEVRSCGWRGAVLLGQEPGFQFLIERTLRSSNCTKIRMTMINSNVARAVGEVLESHDVTPRTGERMSDTVARALGLSDSETERW